MSTLIYVLLSAVYVVFFCWLFLFEYRTYRVRVLRHYLFRIRDELFASARQGRLSFEDRAYGMVRSVANGLILKADSISVPYMIQLFLMCPRKDYRARCIEFEERLSEARSLLSPAGQQAIDKAMLDLGVLILSHVAHISVVLAVPAQLLRLVIRIEAHGERLSFQNVLARTAASADIGRTGSTMQRRLVLLEREAYAIARYTELDCEMHASPA